MRKDKFLKQEAESLDDFLGLVEAYEEISAIRMRKVKKSVLSRREFMQGLNTAFGYIAYAYKIYRKSLKNKQGEHILNTNGRTVHILLSSNTGLYGDIIRDTYSLFSQDPKDNNTDVIIIGRMGKTLHDTYGEGKEYKFFELSDTGVNEDELKKILDIIVEYSEVVVYHGVFKSILSQKPERTHVTGEVMRIEEKLDEFDSNFLFEPSVQDIAEYFEKQIISLVFEQSVFESSLSKFASRMVSLDTAAENIHNKLDKVDFDLKKTKHKRLNSSIKANLAGGMLWK